MLLVLPDCARRSIVQLEPYQVQKEKSNGALSTINSDFDWRVQVESLIQRGFGGESKIGRNGVSTS